jgi:AcrR family transcriptional regulator
MTAVALTHGGRDDGNDSLPMQFSKNFHEKLKVMRCIDRPIRCMTIEEICEKARVSRSTFYRLFETREDFYYWYALAVGSVALDQIGRTMTWRQGMEYHFTLLYQEKVHLRYIAEREDIFNTSYIEKRREQIITKTLQDWRHVPLTPELRFQISAYTHTEAWAAPRWFRANMNIEPMEFARLLENCVPRELHEAMELF